MSSEVQLITAMTRVILRRDSYLKKSKLVNTFPTNCLLTVLAL